MSAVRGRCRARPWLIVGAVLWATGIAACGESEDVSGVWRGGPAVPRADAPPAEQAFLAGGHVELVVGQYGRDVSGLVKVFTTPTALPHLLCPCAVVSRGRTAGGRLQFWFEGCDSGGAQGTLFADLAFTWVDEEEAHLRGTLSLSPDQPPFADLWLERRDNGRVVTHEDKRCPGTWAAAGEAARTSDAESRDDALRGSDGMR